MIERDMRSVYDRIAGQFAERNAEMPATSVAAAERLRELLGPGASVLEVACGAGRDMAWLEGLGFRVTGVDLSQGMLAEARRRAKGPLLQMDMRRLGFGDHRFQGVWASASLLHLPAAEAPRALAEMRRVLVPQGILFLAIQEGAGEGWEKVPYADGERFFKRYSVEEARALLAASGFTVLKESADQHHSRSWLRFLARADRP